MKLLELMHKYESEIINLQPTLEEMDEFICMLDKTYNGVPYGVVTYSTYDKKRGGNGYFISFHDNHGGHKHYHIDVGYVNFDIKNYNVTHLMLDNDNAPLFISFVKEKRK